MSLSALSLARHNARDVDSPSQRGDAVRTEKDIVTVRSPIRAQLGSGSAVKSFRAAADRIVRQETSSPTDVLRLLGSAVSPARTITGEPDEWDIRLGALASLGEYDALAVVASKPTALVRSHNVADPRALRRAVAGGV